MTTTRITRTTLFAILAAALMWQATARAAADDLFGMRVTLDSSYLVLEIKLPALCLRLRTEFPGYIVASAHLLTCDRCFEAPRARSWS